MLLRCSVVLHVVCCMLQMLYRSHITVTVTNYYMSCYALYTTLLSRWIGNDSAQKKALKYRLLIYLTHTCTYTHRHTHTHTSVRTHTHTHTQTSLRAHIHIRSHSHSHSLTLLHIHLNAGDRGVGKSCTLNQAVMWARERGWICLFVPQGCTLLTYSFTLFCLYLIVLTRDLLCLTDVIVLILLII
jgi:hypothetical protein